MSFSSSASSSSSSSTAMKSIHWFRKGLRIHDNPSLLECCTKTAAVYPVFIIDPFFAKPDKIGINRYDFLLQSLSDLDGSLRTIGSRLIVVRGKPEEQLPLLCKEWQIDLVTYESDTEPYARVRDAAISTKLGEMGVKVSSTCSHTLFDMERYIAASKGTPPTTYQSFNKLFHSLGPPSRPAATITSLLMPPMCASLLNDNTFDVPTLQEMGYLPTATLPQKIFRGGETEALRRLQEKVCARPDWVATFEKPETSPNSLSPSTTVLSPYLKFGCLSPALFYYTLADIYAQYPSKHTQPPVSLHGQLLWREFFYFSSFVTTNFGTMVGNAKCKQIPWGQDTVRYEAFKNARTGYPYIDAIMTQLREEGWIHHLARHSVACFFTRGDFWQSWEKGAEIFDLYLLDSDWALNNANWQWLSCSNFFYQYYRCYSPVAFPKKTDKNGDYIRKYLPQLSRYPAKFIYEPWKAPLSVQRECGCLIGDGADCGYPAPIVDHDVVSSENMGKMKAAYAASKEGGGGGDDGDAGSSSSSSSSSSSGALSGSKRKQSTGKGTGQASLEQFATRSPQKKK